MRHAISTLPRRLVLLYVLFAGVWFAFSDLLLAALIADPLTVRWLQTLKGWAFVGISAVLLHALLRRELRMRQHTETALRQSEQRYRRIIETTEEGIWMIDTDNQTTFVNQKMADMLGYTVDEMSGAPLFAFMDAEGQAIAKASLERRRQGIREQIEAKFRRRDSGVLWALVATNPVEDDEGRYAGALAMVTDITERKLAERALQESEERFRCLSEATFEGIVVSDQGRHLAVNAAFVAMMGYSNEEAARMTALDFTAPEYHELVMEKIRSGDEQPYEAIDVRKDGSRFPAEVRGRNMPYQGRMVRVIAVRDITERKQAERALRESEERFRRLSEATFEGIVIHDQAAILEVNTTLASMLGYTPAEMIGKHFTHFTAADFHEHILQNVRTEYQGIYEAVALHKDGTEIPVELHGTSTHYQDRAAWVTAVRDITTRKRADAALHASEQRLSLIFDTVGDVIFLLSVEPEDSFRFIAMNRKGLTVTGLTQEQVVGKRVAEVLPEAAHALVIDKYKEAIRQNKTVRWEEISDYPTGTLYGEVAVTPAWDTAGYCTHLIGSVHDITGIRRAEAALRQYAERLSILHEIDQAILAAQSPEEIAEAALRRIQRLVPCQRASLTLFDYAADQATVLTAQTDGLHGLESGARFALKDSGWVEQLRQNGGFVVDDIVSLSFPTPIVQALHAEGIRSYMNLPLLVKDELIGAFNLASTSPGAFLPEHTVIASEVAYQLAVAMQSARLREELQRHAVSLEQRVTERTAQLQTANKDLEAFSYSVSHDLRAPLRSVSGFAEIIARRHRNSLNEEGRHYLDNIIEASARMSRLIDDLLAYARLGRTSLRRQPVSLHSLLTQIVKDLAVRITETGADFDLPDELPVVHGDPTLLNQIFANLFGNALTYHRPHVPPLVTISWRAEADYVVVGISDNGIGVPPEHHDKIFNVFQRLHSEDDYPGTGIGLAIVKKSVELLSGRVWVESVVGEGSTFSVQLPKE
jgi:PAS domain S-box-containing protein